MKICSVELSRITILRNHPVTDRSQLLSLKEIQYGYQVTAQSHNTPSAVWRPPVTPELDHVTLKQPGSAA